MEDAVDHEAGRARALAALDEARARAGRPARRPRPAPTVDLRAVDDAEPPPGPTDAAAAARIAELEAEVARLRRLLAEIHDRSRDGLA